MEGHVWKARMTFMVQIHSAFFSYSLQVICNRISTKAMFPWSAGKASSGPVPAGQPLMDVKASQNHRWLSENCNNSCQTLNFWYMWHYRGAGSSSRMCRNQGCLTLPLLLSSLTAQSWSPWSSISPLYPFLCLLSSLSLKSFCLLSACISVTGKSKHISCVQGGFQWHQSVPPTELSSRWKYLAMATDISPCP